ncbi:threonyl-tRNA synthetase [Candidatus Uzinura diaspidicola str. ASNER]|uniref:Threonine--tRNA ligase n=1 Tax=Candidatus Uzinura diaspidicola str. ASNER TaxID=1133592 RepID=L7VKC0_9FLAO|nr:threonyl-tRNA synthetase [Candidatus Uzinura diaspidicola str. ASNER]
MICIKFYDGFLKDYPSGITPIEIALDMNEKKAREVLSASINGHQVELSTPITKINIQIVFYSWENTLGKKAFWHSSIHLLGQTLLQIHPQAKLTIGNPIENGFYYDVDLVDGPQQNFSSNLEERMLENARKNSIFELYSIYKAKSLDYYKENLYKIDIIKNLQEGDTTFCSNDDFVDLCRGTHIFSSGKIKYVKILNSSGVYWHSDEKNQQLTRVYGISFPNEKHMNEYLLKFEEAKKRDHRKLGKELDLFNFSDNVGAGLPLWKTKGTVLRRSLEDFLMRAQKKYGYEMVVTPHIGNKKLYKISGHIDKYENDSFLTRFSHHFGEEILLKSMNCPHHCELFKSQSWSYRDLPKRFAEFGNVYRYEQSGELHGLTRTRGFTQDDAHIFCTTDQLVDEFHRVIDLVLYILKSLGFEQYTIQISLRDLKIMNKYIGKEQNWKKAEEDIIEAVCNKNLPTKIIHGEAAFYGPKLDFLIQDSLKRNWQLGTIQIDYSLPERFDLQYQGPDNLLYRPVIIHRAPFGSLERFIALLIEHTGGNFPFWLSPIQVILIPISEKYIFYAEKILHLLYKYGIRSNIDLRSEKTGKKIRDAEINKIPFMAIVGEKEMYDGTISIRAHTIGNMGKFTFEAFLELLFNEA